MKGLPGEEAGKVDLLKRNNMQNQDIGSLFDETPAREQSDIHTVKLSDITARPDWQVRKRLNEKLIREYATNYAYGAAFPPVALALVNGGLFLTDGWHRLAALHELGRDTVEATVEEMTAEEAQWKAAIANTVNGLRLTRQECREVFRCFVKTGRHRAKRGYKSYRDIAWELKGLAGKSTLQRWMQLDFPKIARRMNDGREDAASVKETPAERPSTPFEDAMGDLQETLKELSGKMRSDACPTARHLFALAARRAAERLEAEAVKGAVWAPDRDDNPDF